MSDEPKTSQAESAIVRLRERIKARQTATSPLVRELRVKFIVAAMLASALVIVGIVAFVDVSYWQQMQRQFDTRLDMLARFDGSFDNMVEGSEQGQSPWMHDEGRPEPREELEPPEASESEPNSDDTSEYWQQDGRPRRHFYENDGFGLLTNLHGLTDSNGLSPEVPFQMRYFSATYSEDSSSFSSVDVSRIASVSESEAYEMAEQVRSAGRTRGYLSTMRYYVHKVDESTTIYLFLDCTSDIVNLRSLVLASLFIVAIALLLVFVLVVIFSKHVVAPVAESYSRQRRFITDASHDLKTPLAVIGSDVEVIEMLEGKSEWTDSIRHQVERMTDLTNKLVMLSRMDEGSTEIHKEDFDLEALSESVVLEFRPMAEASGKRIVCNAATHLTAHADATLIDQALHLLIDNALKYSSDGAVITVSAGYRRGGSYLTVANPVEEIEPGSHDELFERFTRADSSRSSATGGHGIGLAVVKAIAEAHGGSAHASSKDAHNIEFRLEF